MKAIIYLRVSTEEQAEKGFSIQAQREEGCKKAHELGCNEIIEFCDEGVSGSILERPGLISAFNRMGAGDIDYFICFDSSRLSRNVSHQLIILDEIKRIKVQLVFIKNIYEDSPEGRFQLTIMSAVDEYERARFRFRSEMGKRAKASQGKLTHSPGLYGYDYNKDDDTLSANEEEAKYVKLMYGWVVSEKIGPHAIAMRLNDLGIPTKKNKLWQKTTVKRILNNTAYKGTLYIRRYDSRDVKLNKYKPPEERVSRKERPRDEWIPISVPPIVDDQIWNEVQQVMLNARRLWGNKSKADYLLSAIVRCGICGRTVHGNLVSSKNRKYRYYVCSGRSPGEIGSEKCTLGFLNADELERVIWERVLRWLQNPDELENEIRSGTPDDLEQKEHKIEKLRKEIEGLEKEKNRVATMYQKDLISESDMEKRLKEIRNKLFDLSESQNSIVNDIITYKAQQKEINQVSQLSYKIMGSIENLKFLDKQEIVRSLISEVIVAKDTIRIKAKVPTVIQDIDI